jgi:predicted ATPase/predicted Ser/Thr protein kinase
VTPEEYRRAEEVFHAALAVPPPHRARFLADACTGDPGLQDEVESLLAAQQAAGHFIERPAMEVAAALIAADTATVTAGTRIGRYEVVSRIGRGGMGEVYRARDVSLGREVALKLPRQPYAGGTEAVRRFEQEARAASSLNHPNIITVHEIGETDGRRFIAMELVDGRSLSPMIGQALPPRDLLHIGRQLAKALAVAHAAGIVHGDVKPENVMLRTDGYVKVLDFGIARLASIPSADDSATGPTAAAATAMLGTPRYMAPEQARGEPASAPSDVFACGVVLYELATGRHPFIVDTATSSSRASRASEPIAPSSGGSRLPSAVEALLLRMLEPLPVARPTARDVAAALDAMTSAQWNPGRPQHNLPLQRAAFVGRSAEVAAIESMLLNPAIRLTSLTGPGGTGKTRLAVEVAARLAHRFGGGVSFVNLAPADDVKAVVSAVARAHGVSDAGERTPVDALAEHFRSRGPTLLVLDNFEHVTAAAVLVRDLLDSCAALTVLVTSRTVLRLYGEHEFPVAPLTLPEADSGPPEQLLRAAAVELFVQRAAAVRPEFTLTNANGRAVAEVCRRLDGLPLAIELAAARVKILAPAELLARLDRRLDLLTGGPHDLPLRQQTLRSTIDWSYDLLSPPDQRLFRRLSVFAGGCTLEAVEAVCNTAEDLGVDVLSGVSALVDNSLLVQRTLGDGQSRYVLLETIREYARERLDEGGEAPSTLHAHAAYALVLAEEGTHEREPAEREAWLRTCDLEHDNLRTAITYLVAAGPADWGLRLGIALFKFWEWREHLSEGRECLAAILASSGASATAPLRGRALYYAGILANSLHDFVEAEALVREAHELYRQIGDPAGEATTKGSLAWQMVQIGGSPAEAQALLEEAATLWERLGDNVTADQARSNLATVAKAAGNASLARTMLERVAENSSTRGDIRSLATALNALGDLAAGSGDAANARRRHQDSLARFRELDDRGGIARVLADLGDLDIAAGEFGAASISVAEALNSFAHAGHQRGVARQLEALSWCVNQRSQHAAAVTLASAADAIRQRIRVPIGAIEHERVELALADARRQLPAPEYERAWSDGQTMTVSELARLAHV